MLEEYEKNVYLNRNLLTSIILSNLKQTLLYIEIKLQKKHQRSAKIKIRTLNQVVELFEGTICYSYCATTSGCRIFE